ncbi:MAG: ribonuclease protein component [Pseudomonadota bacterium]|jgi:ribonuclease P protein component
MNKFTQQHRLHKADDFSSVFVFRKVKVGKWFKIHYKPNSLAVSRLGLIVSKKVHKRANQRNYMKRVIREFFRQKQLDWQSVDLIIRVQRHFTPQDYPLVIQELSQLCRVFGCYHVSQTNHSNNS